MGRLDVLKSLVRSTAKRAASSLGELELGQAAGDLVQQALLRRMVVDEAQLTAAVCKLGGIESATVSVTEYGIAVQVSDDRGQDLSVTLHPQTVSFAPRGAKEITFAVDPPEANSQPRCAEVFGAVASELACTLWATVLPRTESTHQVFVHRHGASLSADLRTVPGVRQALGNPVGAALIDTLRLREVTLAPGRIQLRVGVEGLG